MRTLLLLLISISAQSQCWTSVSAGFAHSAGIKNGKLYTWGNNSMGQLGLGDYLDRHTPTQVGNDSNYIAVACGGNHTLALKSNGTLFSFGQGIYGQLGIGTNLDHNAPQQVPGNDWKRIFAGNYHSFALKPYQTYAWGLNSFGQLGDGTTVNKNSPTLVDANSNYFVQLDGGNEHSIALRADGSVWTCGRNNEGQLGDSTTIDSYTFKKIATKAKQVNAGLFYSNYVKNNGDFYITGDNTYGCFGDGTNGSSLWGIITFQDAKMSTGNAHSILIANGGKYFVSGYNANGELGTGTNTDIATWQYINQNAVISTSRGMHSIILLSTGQAISTGMNLWGELGNGNFNNQNQWTGVICPN